MEIELNILIIRAVKIPDVAFAARIQVRRANDQVVDTQRRLDKKEPLSEGTKLDVFFEGIY